MVVVVLLSPFVPHGEMIDPTRGVLLDPTSEEEESGGGSTMTLAIMKSTGEVTQWCQRGTFEAGSMDAAIELASDGCAMIHTMMRQRLLEAMETKSRASQQQEDHRQTDGNGENQMS